MISRRGDESSDQQWALRTRRDLSPASNTWAGNSVELGVAGEGDAG